MVKVGGYILGEFGNLIAGDQRSSPAVQFQLLHSKVSSINSCVFKHFMFNILMPFLFLFFFSLLNFSVSLVFSNDPSVATFNLYQIC